MNKLLQKHFEERFDAEPMSGCWIWNGSCNHKGYGYFTFNGLRTRAHRESWEIYRGRIPMGLQVLHKCDVRCCVNPDHLFLGTDKDNSADMVLKGRAAKGSNNGFSKLTEEDIPKIRQLLKEGDLTQTEIGELFGVGYSAISAVKIGSTWGHIR